MVTVDREDRPLTALQMIFDNGTPKKAVLTALFAGTILTAINHGDLILVGSAPEPWKVVLTYCVP